MYRIFTVQKKNSDCMNRLNLPGIGLQRPPFYHPNTGKTGRQTQPRTGAPRASLHADPTATKSTPPAQLFPSIGTRRAVKFKKEHLFLIGGAFKCSLKCPGRPFLVLFHNGRPAFLIVLQVQLWLRKPQLLRHFLWKTPGETGGESWKLEVQSHFYHHSPFLYFLGVFIFFNYSIGFTELEDPGASAPVSPEAREGRAWKPLVALVSLMDVFSHLL